MLALDRVFKNFRPGVPTLTDVNLTVERGEFVFITGASGAGKSTLLKLIYRELTADRGHILFCGRDIARLSQPSIPFLRRNLGIIFQDFRLVEHWSVFENVAIALQVLRMPARVVRERVQAALERVGLSDRGEELISRLSGGEQQRVGVARAIVTEPPLVLADEPTGNLDPHLALDILTLLEEVNAAGTTVLFATHDHSLLDQRTHRVVMIEQGQVVDARSGLHPLPASHASIAS